MQIARQDFVFSGKGAVYKTKILVTLSNLLQVAAMQCHDRFQCYGGYSAKGTLNCTNKYVNFFVVASLKIQHKQTVLKQVDANTNPFQSKWNEF